MPIPRLFELASLVRQLRASGAGLTATYKSVKFFQSKIAFFTQGLHLRRDFEPAGFKPFLRNENARILHIRGFFSPAGCFPVLCGVDQHFG
jgi:hypothetical protein